MDIPREVFRAHLGKLSIIFRMELLYLVCLNYELVTCYVDNHIDNTDNGTSISINMILPRISHVSTI